MSGMAEDYSIWPEYPGSEPSNDEDFRVTFGDCPRAGGGYTITTQAAGQLKLLLNQLSEEGRNGLSARLTTILIDRRRQGDRLPLVTPTLVKEAKSNRSLAVHERADRLLRYLADRANSVGETTEINWEPSRVFETDLSAMAWSESTNLEEVNYFLRFLVERNWVSNPGQISYQVTVDGHGRISDQAANVDSSQAFVAMCPFNDEVMQAFEKGIRPAVETAGYKPMRIDRKPDVEKIDDEIIAEIRRSRFLVADFTHGKDGARGGVYYEAGFAHGLGIPVICTCRHDLVNELHFDTRQYHHTVWKSHEDLRDALKNRILAIVGEGPDVHSHGK